MPEDDFIYQARRPAQPMERAVRRIALLSAAGAVVVILVAVFWGGVRATGFGPPPVIEPPAGPLRIAPQNPGGLTVPEANVPIMSGDDASSATPQLAAPAPAPDISALDQAAGITPAPAAPAAPAPASPPAPAGPAVVQLAATADEASAEALWTQLQTRLPAFFGGRTPSIFPAVVNGQNLWRLRLGGFASAADARSFCAAVQAKGAACTVAAF